MNNRKKLEEAPFGLYSVVPSPSGVHSQYLDVEKFSVKIDHSNKFFPRKEFQLLYFLASNPGKVMKRETLLKEIWGNDVYVYPRTIDTHIANLRKKVENDPENPEYIVGVRGIGYKFKG